MVLIATFEVACAIFTVLSVVLTIHYRAELDGARPCAASDMRDTRMGIPYRAKPDGARPCAASDMRDTRMGIPCPQSTT